MKEIEPAVYSELVRRALEEDLGAGDITTDATVPGDRRAHGVFLAKSDLVLAGIGVALEVLRQRAPGLEHVIHRRDGDRCGRGDQIAEVWGPARALLEGAGKIGHERGDSSVHALLWNLATLEWMDDRWVRALGLADELCELGAEAEYERHIAFGLGGRAAVLALLGDEEETRRAIAEAAGYGAGDGGRVTNYLGPFALGSL